MSRSIIVGKDVNTVRRILFVLSYFIRCNEVYERMEHIIPVENQFEERKKVQGKCENNLQDNISLKFSSPENVSNALSSFSSTNVIETDNLNKKVEIKNAAEIYKTKSLDVNNSRQAADSRRGSVNSDLSFIDNPTEKLLEVPMPK